MLGHMKIIAVSLAAGLVAACGTVDIAQMPVKGGAFEKGLRDGYVKLANSEYDQTDLRSGDQFSERAKMSAMGKLPVPENLTARKLVRSHRDELTIARERLMTAFGNRAAQKVPGDASKAQVSFDCWMEQAEENIQPKDIAACRSKFRIAMARIEAALADKVVAAKPEKKKAKRKRKPQTVKYVLYFGFNSAKLTKASMTAIDFVKGEVKKRAKVSVASFADRSGSTEYNDNLAIRRATAVLLALKNAGVKNEIRTTIHGEARNAVKTKDGARERLNRRVEISVKQ